MACQIFQWIIAGADRTTLEHAALGIGCVVAYEGLLRWRRSRKAASFAIDAAAEIVDEYVPDSDQRRAA